MTGPVSTVDFTVGTTVETERRVSGEGGGQQVLPSPTTTVKLLRERLWWWRKRRTFPLRARPNAPG